MVNCLNCNNKFDPHRWSSEKFCCRQCYFIYRNEHPEVYPNPLKGKDRTGKNNPRYGIEVSIETRIKMSEAQKGIKKPYLTGENNGQWKGGLTSINDQVRKSFEYSEWRRSVYQRDNYTCQKCGQVGKTLHAHHIESFNNNPKLRTEIKNGVTLCKKCHKNFHHIFGKINTIKQFINFIKNY
jgi:hypothetical protein